MVLTDEWFTTLSHTDDKQLVFLNVRKDIGNFFSTGKLRVRVDIAFPYSAEADGMPDAASAKLLEEIEPLLRRTMERDKLAILTGNYTGGGQKDWTFYTRHLPTFGERLNACLEPFPTLPLEIHCEEDAEWSDYFEMLQLAEADDAEAELD